MTIEELTSELAESTADIRERREFVRLLERLEAKRDVAIDNMRDRLDGLSREVDNVRRGLSSGELLIQTSGIQINAYAAQVAAYTDAINRITETLGDLYDKGLTIAPDPNA